MPRIFILLISLFLCASASSQNINLLLKTTDNLLLDAKYPEAINFVDKNLSQIKTEKDQIVFLNKKADAYIRSGKFDEARQLLNDLQQKIGSVKDNKVIFGITLSNVGNLYLNQGRTDLAQESLQKALSTFEEANKTSSLEAAQTLSYLGLLYMSRGQYSQAEEQMQMALTLRQSPGNESQELIAATYNDLGLVTSQLDKDKALDYYEKALTIYKKLHGEEHPKIAFANINIGIVYRELELYGDAVNNFETALKIWEKVYLQPHQAKAIALYNLGQTYQSMGNEEAAKGYYDRALNMYELSFGKKHPDVANVLNAIGRLYASQNEYDAALAAYQKALIANVSDFNDQDVSRNPGTEGFYNGNVLLYSLLFKAKLFESRYNGKTLKFQELKDALSILHKCDTLIDQLRQQTTNENDKIALGVIANEVYGDGVRIAYTAGLNAFKKKAYFEDAFYFGEKSKSAVLLDAISDADAKSFAGIPQSLLEEEKDLKSAIALCAQKLSQRPSPEEEKYLHETAFNLKRSYDAFTQRLEKEFPEYFNLKFNQTSPSISQLQQLLDDRTALLSYFIDDQNNHLYIFQITRKDYKIIDHSLAKDFDKYITGLRNSLVFNEIKTFKLSAYQLYKQLIPKIPAGIQRLVLLPTGRLSVVPFEALITEDSDENNDYQKLPYLINRFGLRYEFSAGLILQKEKGKGKDGQPSILLCAPVTFPERDNLNELPGTASEVKEISNLFSGKNLTASVHLNQQASEKLIKSGNLKTYSYIHFATHGIVDEDNPELSRIFLQNDTDSEDGNLFAGEIYNLELDANLVTLSACQTGLGKISKGEGVIGLSRALVYAGAKSIIVSFWNVADESTAKMMQDFYKQLLDNPDADYCESLRLAKVNLLRDGKYAAPYYWAPFILIGF